MLYIVATPIGNLEDITLRALRVLKEVDMIAAEDTRHTRKLLTHFDIKTRLVSFHEHSSAEKRIAILDALRDGLHVALVSDAGTPLISDPGAVLVREAMEQGLPVTTLPGPCAAIAAMTLTGWGGPFLFVGFLSKKGAERKAQIQSIASSDVPCIVYESPHALHDTLTAFCEAMGNERTITVCKELTKLHEAVFNGTMVEAADMFSGEVKGEYVLVVSAKRPEETGEVDDNAILSEIEAFIAAGMTKKDAAKAASEKLGISKNRAYRLSLS